MSAISDDVLNEHRRLADLIESLGPEAPGGVSDWTASDLAAHLMWQSAAAGLVLFPGRVLMARGIRLNGGAATSRADARYRRKDFGAAVASLRQGPPRLLLRDSIAPVALFEVWMHHDDLRRANQLPPPEEPDTLGRSVDFALHYQRKVLGTTPVDLGDSPGDMLRWLAGRPSTIPAHSPPLRF